MSVPRTSALTLPSGTRRRTPKASQNRKVPLWTPDPGGQLFEGIIRVPVGLCNTQEHTNERLKFDALIRENLARWTEWRKQRGWYLAETPRVAGPFDPPQGDRDSARIDHVKSRIGEVGSVNAVTDFDYADEYKWYICEARFTLETPIYIGLEDMLELRHLAFRYGVDPDRDSLPYNELPEGKDVIEVEGGLDPMKVAEERRQRLGLKREDFLFGPLHEPL